MLLKIRTVIVVLSTFLAFSVALPVLAVSHRGGEWTYGARHEPNNWGAFSNYYHAQNTHWAYVGSTSRNNQSRVVVGAGLAAHSSINTNIGEHVNFDAGW